MSELRYPNESKAYRDARDALLKDEKELLDKTKAVAAKRRMLPDGGPLKEDYVFQWANEGKVGQRVNFSELFGARVRYTGASLVYQLTSVFSGGLAPFVATLLLSRYGSGAVAAYIVVCCAITAVAAWFAPETHRGYVHDASADSMPSCTSTCL